MTRPLACCLIGFLTLLLFGCPIPASADGLTGGPSGPTSLPGDPYIFAWSNATGGTPVSLDVTDANGNSYVFSTTFDEINAGIANEGWWSPTLTNSNSNANFIAGGVANDFFTFNLGQNTIAAPIVSATLVIPTDYGFCTPEPSCETDGLPVTYTVGSVSIDAATLNNKSANPNATIYNALGSGTVYGQVNVTDSTYTNPIDITLDSAAISDLNENLNANDFFSIGGTVSVPTPEPSSAMLLGAGLFGLLFLFRRGLA